MKLTSLWVYKKKMEAQISTVEGFLLILIGFHDFLNELGYFTCLKQN